MAVIVAKSSDNNQIYFTVNESLVKVPVEKVTELIRDIDKMAQPRGKSTGGNFYRILSEDEDRVNDILNQGAARGKYIPGQIWFHPDVIALKVKIIAVLAGTKRKVTQQLLIPKQKPTNP